MIFKDYYKILGLETNKASAEEIKNAYRIKAKQYHPDINVGDNSSEEIFKDVNEAYKILSNPKSKRKYDFQWRRYANRQEESTERRTFKEWIMGILFGSAPTAKQAKKEEKTPQYGENVTTEISVSLKDAFFGAKKSVKLKSVKGKDIVFEFNIPAGIQNHDKIRIIGQGKEGKNGGQNGDLFIVVNIKDGKDIRLVGKDLYIDMNLTTYEAALGTIKQIKIFKEDIEIQIPECTKSGKEIKIKQKGYKDGKGSRGDLHIITHIVFPKTLTPEVKKLYEKIGKEENKTKKRK